MQKYYLQNEIVMFDTSIVSRRENDATTLASHKMFVSICGCMRKIYVFNSTIAHGFCVYGCRRHLKTDFSSNLSLELSVLRYRICASLVNRYSWYASISVDFPSDTAETQDMGGRDIGYISSMTLTFNKMVWKLHSNRETRSN